MSEEVKRYDPIGDDGIYSFNNIEMSDDGEYVLYTDYESERTAHDTTKWKVKQLEAKLELFSASKDKLIKAIEKLIEKKDPSSEEREIWALEEALDIINSKLPE